MKANGGVQRAGLDVSLRGTLAHEYTMLHEQDAANATRWIRQLVKDAFDKDPGLLTLVQLNKATGHKRYLIGRKDEYGRYPPDW